MAPRNEHSNLTVGAWLPADWHRPLTPDEKSVVKESDIDIFLIPENHDTWANRDSWKQAAEEMGTTIYAGLKKDGWTLGLFYDPDTGFEKTYTKHSTSEHIALEKEGWTPEEYLHTITVDDVELGTTICHDHYISTFMRYESIGGATILLNLSASPVVRRKWGEVLQARAIENSAYVVCTMHGRDPSGEEPTTNKGHVFAFDPFGEQIVLEEVGTGREQSLFETKPDNIYTLEMDPSVAVEARQTLTDQDQRRPINRIRENVFNSSKATETTLDTRVDGGELHLTYANQKATVEIGESTTLDLGDETIYLVSLDSGEVFQPERLYEMVLGISDVENCRLLIHNHWDHLTESYLRNTVEPILRARCVEWCSPVLVTSPEHTKAYQLANKHKDTHELPTSENDRFHFELKRAFGVRSTLKPIDGERGPLEDLAKRCASYL